MLDYEAGKLIIIIETGLAPEQYRQQAVTGLLSIAKQHDFANGNPCAHYYLLDLIEALVSTQTPD